MKKLFVAFMALATIGMVSCKKEDANNNPPTPPPTPVDEIPTNISTPDAGKMTFVVCVDKTYNEQICNTIGMIGGFCSYEAASAAVFEKVAETENWYSYTMDVTDATTFGNSKLTVVAEDGSTAYDYEGTGGEYALMEGTDAYLKLGDDYGTANCIQLVEGADLNQKILYVRIGKFKANPCAAYITYTINAKFPEICEESNILPAVIGNFKGSGWGTAFDMTWNEAGACWTVEIEGQANNEFKFQAHAGSWDGQPQESVLNDETGEYEWKDFANIVLTDETAVTFDFSDPEKYRWPECNGEKVEYNEAGEVTITVTVTNREYQDGDVCVLAGNFEENAWSTDAYPMTYDAQNGVWTWTGMVPADFKFKAVYNGSWASGDDVKLLKDLSNATVSFTI
ncbi:MAG: hypothetical protein MJZ65_01625 [Paludibacteraceae bacterium]|nr:hypothetical protein [Paludibacteraceae bacterium]